MTAAERMQYGIVRMLSFLPPRLQVWLSREAPLIMDGRRYDAMAQLLRTIRRRTTRYGLVEPSVEQGRRRFRYDTRVFRGPMTKVDAVREFEIPGAAGSLRVRHYVFRGARDLTVYFHGGGFAIGDLDTHDEPCRMLCRHARVQVLSVSYRLAPEHPFPAAVEDARAALAWALTNVPALGAERVSVGGDSAGANLATSVCIAAARFGRPAPAAQLLIYPPIDSHHPCPSHELFAKGFMLTMRDVEMFDQLYLATVDRSDPTLSLLHAPELSRLPPALIVTAGFDLLRDEGNAYAKALRAAGVAVREREVESLSHGFIHTTGVCRAARDAMITIATDWRALLDASGRPS